MQLGSTRRRGSSEDDTIPARFRAGETPRSDGRGPCRGRRRPEPDRPGARAAPLLSVSRGGGAVSRAPGVVPLDAARSG
jgi:hypothetical protein